MDNLWKVLSGEALMKKLPPPFGGKGTEGIEPPLKGMKYPEWLDRVTEVMMMSGVDVGMAPLGMIKRGTPAVKRAMREAIKRERGLRKSDLLYSGLPEGEVKSLVDDVLEMTWFHGRRTYPKGKRHFGASRRGQTNLGEPGGISVTTHPGVAGRFTREPEWAGKVGERYKDQFLRLERKIYNKYPDVENVPYEIDEIEKWADEGFKKTGDRAFITLKKIAQKKEEGFRSIARVLPEIGRRPSDVILPGWKGRGTEYAQRELRDVYRQAAREMMESEKGQVKRLLEQGMFPEEWKDWLNEYRRKEVMNKRIGELLKERGWEGILYSPGRYGEYELKMLDPEKVRMIDWRSIGELRRGRPLSMERIARSGMKPTYDYPHPSARERMLYRWEKKAAGEGGTSLGVIYKDVDLQRLAKEVVGVPEVGKSYATTIKESGKLPEDWDIVAEAFGPEYADLAVTEKIDDLAEKLAKKGVFK